MYTIEVSMKNSFTQSKALRYSSQTPTIHSRVNHKFKTFVNKTFTAAWKFMKTMKSFSALELSWYTV